MKELKFKVILIVIVVLLLLVVVLNMRNRVFFSPDSTNYLAAAKTFKEHGTFFGYTNWPSYSMKVEPEPFTDYPPGFPVYTLPFLYLFQDPVISAYAAQVVSIILLFIVVLVLLHKLEFHFFTRISVLVCFGFLTAFQVIYRGFLTEALFVAVSLGILICVKGILENSKKIYWIIGLVLLAISGTIKFMGVLNVSFFLVPILLSRKFKTALFRTTAVFSFACLPLVLWFLRNKILYGFITRTHWGGPLDFDRNVTTPFQTLYSLMGNTVVRFVLTLLLLVVVCGYPIYKAFSSSLKNVQPQGFLKLPVLSDKTFNIYLATAVGMIGHFVGLYVLSLLTNFNELGLRLLSPTIALTLFLFAFGLDDILERLENKKLKYAKYGVMIFLALFFLVHPAFNKNVPLNGITHLFEVEQSKEKFIWDEIRKMEALKGATHFYSDYNFKHQVFTHIPHRIIWDEKGFKKVETIQRLANSGQSPFFLFSKKSRLNAIMNNHYQELGFKKVEFHDYGHVLYYLPN